MCELHGHPLRVARIQHNLTQKQLAEAARVGAMTVWRAENDYPINAASRQRLCDYFGMTACDLGLLGRNFVSTDDVPSKERPAGKTTDIVTATPTPLLHREVQPPQYAPTQAIDLLCEMPNMSLDWHASAWLALGAGSLDPLFEAGWSIEGILNSLRVVLQGIQGMPALTRRRLLQLGGIAVASAISTTGEEQVSEEDQRTLCESLGRSIEAGWGLFLKASPHQLLAIGHTQLHMLEQVYPLFYPEVRASYYSSVLRLIGAALFFQARYAEAMRVYERAYLAALEAGDSWHMAECLGWQSG